MRSMYPRHGHNPRPGGRCGRQGVPHFEARVPCLLGNGVFPSHLFHFWNKTHILIKFRRCVYYIMIKGHPGKHRNSTAYNTVDTHSQTHHTPVHTHMSHHHTRTRLPPPVHKHSCSHTRTHTRSDTQPTTPTHTLTQLTPPHVHTYTPVTIIVRS